MKAVRQIRMSELDMILSKSNSTSPTNSKHVAAVENDYADLLGGDDPTKAPAYSGEVVAKNTELLSEVVEIEQLLETTAEVQLEGVRSQRAVLRSRNDSSVKSIELFDEQYRFPVSSYFNKEKLIEHLELDVHVGSLIKNLKVAKKIGKLKLEIGSLRNVPESPVRGEPSGDGLLQLTPRTNMDQASAVSTARSHISGMSVLPAEVGQTITKMEELLAVLHGKLNSADLQAQVKEELVGITGAYFGHEGVQLGSSMVQLNAMAFTDVMQFIKSKVSSMSTQLESRLAQMKEKEKSYQVAKDSLSAENVQSFEKSLREYLDAIEDSMRINADRLNQLMMNSESDGNFRSTYETCSEKIKTIVSEQRSNKAELLKEITTDQQKLEGYYNARSLEADTANAKYNMERDQALQQIRYYADEQDKLWEQVEGLVAQIGVLGQQRAVIVKEHQTRTENEAQRRRHFDEYCAVHHAHVAHISSLKELSTYTLKLLDQVDLFFEHMTTAVEAKNFEEGLHEIKLVDQELFAKLYHPFVLVSTDLLARKNARRLTTARTSRILSAQAVNPDDPERQDATVKAAEANRLLEELTVECEAIATRMEKWEPLYENVVEQLDADQATYEDPRLQCHEEWNAIVSKVRDAAANTSNLDDSELAVQQEEVEGIRVGVADRQVRFEAVRSNSPPRKVVKRSRMGIGRTPRTPK